mmetsp:Transcript_27420/g.36675  ORF Transcript_27420/g.36675 Transcript_27420/m.36675 type:complete len:98 (+) Transcript_27420:1926-2219(+)
MAWTKSRQERQDWSDDNDESMVENDTQSIASIDGKVHVKENLQQNSLFSSIAPGGHNTSISISGGNSLIQPTESRLKQVSKGTHGVDEDGTIGGAST